MKLLVTSPYQKQKIVNMSDDGDFSMNGMSYKVRPQDLTVTFYDKGWRKLFPRWFHTYTLK